jgi:hypothetical protein
VEPWRERRGMSRDTALRAVVERLISQRSPLKPSPSLSLQFGCDAPFCSLTPLFLRLHYCLIKMAGSMTPPRKSSVGKQAGWLHDLAMEVGRRKRGGLAS